MTTDTEIVSAFLKAELHAREKHPVFADFFQNEKLSDLTECRQLLHEVQVDNDRAERNRTSSAVGIMLEELLEAFMAHYDGHNLEHCLFELHQLGGCVVSAVRMIEREIQQRENMKRIKPNTPQRDSVAKKGRNIHKKARKEIAR